MSVTNHSDTPTPTWTDEKIEQLKVLWEQGLSGSAIGRALGVTKSAAIGKAHRLKLKSRPSPIKQSDSTKSQVGVSATRRRAIMSATSTRGDCLKQKEAEDQAAVEVVTGNHLDNEDGAQQDDLLTSDTSTTDGWVDTEIKEGPTSIANKVLAELEQSMAPVKTHDFNIKPVLEKSTSQQKGRSRCKECQWPVGEPDEPDFHYCGADTLSGKPYCAEHCAVAYVVKGRKEEAA